MSGPASRAMWPARGETPINEFHTEGYYFTCTFPTLFPTGDADFLAPRINTVTIGNYFKCLLLYIMMEDSSNTTNLDILL